MYNPYLQRLRSSVSIGFLYPSDKLFSFAAALEINHLYVLFSYTELDKDRLVNMATCLQKNCLLVGGAQHGAALTRSQYSSHHTSSPLYKFLEQGKYIFPREDKVPKAYACHIGIP